MKEQLKFQALGFLLWAAAFVALALIFPGRVVVMAFVALVVVVAALLAVLWAEMAESDLGLETAERIYGRRLVDGPWPREDEEA